MNRKQRRARVKARSKPVQRRSDETAAALPVDRNSTQSESATLIRQAANALAEGRNSDAALAARAVPADVAAWPQAQLLLGAALYRLGDYTAAVAALETVLSARPNVAQAQDLLGVVRQAQGRWSQAADAHRRAVALAPNEPSYLSNLGRALLEAGDVDAAVATLRRATAVLPSAPPTLMNFGKALVAADQPEEAVAVYDQATRLAPGLTAAAIGLGYARTLTGDLAGALHAFDQAEGIDGESADLLSKRALALAWQGRAAESRAALERALALAPDAAEARFQLGQSCLEAGQLTAGWAGYDRRFATGRTLPNRRFSVPAWTGEPLHGQSLLVWPEQGLGDEILFASCVRSLLANADGPVILESDRRLLGLFRRSWPDADCRPDSHRTPESAEAGPKPERTKPERVCPAGTLPRLLRGSLSRFPRDTAFLSADARMAANWRAWLETLGSGLRLGLCWRSQLRTAKRRGAYFELDQWRPLLSVAGCHAISLQYDATAEEVAAINREHGGALIAAPDADLRNDQEALAALLVNLDLVVSAPTAVAELAGALGIPVWRVTSGEDWTQLGTGCRPWFPSHRPWRPGRPGSGGGALAPLVRALLKHRPHAAPTADAELDRPA